MFSLATWNVWFDELERQHRYAALIKEITGEGGSGPDVLCFQEATKPFLDAVSRAPGFLQEYAPAEDIRSTNIADGGYDVVMYVKKKHTIISTETIHLKSKMYRRCLVVELELHPSCTSESSSGTAASDGAGKGKDGSSSSSSSSSGMGKEKVTSTATTTASASTPPPAVSCVKVATVHLESQKGNAAYRADQLLTILPRLIAPAAPPPPPPPRAAAAGGGSTSTTTATATTTTPPTNSTHHLLGTFLCGDFNFCSTRESENKLIDGNTAVTDVWKSKYSHMPVIPDGFTEDSHINEMMHRAKASQAGGGGSSFTKQVRFDRILLIKAALSAAPGCRKEGAGGGAPAPVQACFGSKCHACFMARRSVSRKLAIHDITRLGLHQVDPKEYPGWNPQASIWPSDHFGLVADFDIVEC